MTQPPLSLPTLCRIYGAGLKFAKQLLQNFNPTLSDARDDTQCYREIEVIGLIFHNLGQIGYRDPSYAENFQITVTVTSRVCSVISICFSSSA